MHSKFDAIYLYSDGSYDAKPEDFKFTWAFQIIHTDQEMSNDELDFQNGKDLHDEQLAAYCVGQVVIDKIKTRMLELMGKQIKLQSLQHSFG